MTKKGNDLKVGDMVMFLSEAHTITGFKEHSTYQEMFGVHARIIVSGTWEITAPDDFNFEVIATE